LRYDLRFPRLAPLKCMGASLALGRDAPSRSLRTTENCYPVSEPVFLFLRTIQTRSLRFAQLSYCNTSNSGGPFIVIGSGKEGGFYKRGCQVKTLYPSQGGFAFLGLQPLPATRRSCDRVVRITTHFRVTPSVGSVLLWAPTTKSNFNFPGALWPLCSLSGQRTANGDRVRGWGA
jgi:hypothetical protein